MLFVGGVRKARFFRGKGVFLKGFGKDKKGDFGGTRGLGFKEFEGFGRVNRLVVVVINGKEKKDRCVREREGGVEGE